MEHREPCITAERRALVDNKIAVFKEATAKMIEMMYTLQGEEQEYCNMVLQEAIDTIYRKTL